MQNTKYFGVVNNEFNYQVIINHFEQTEENVNVCNCLHPENRTYRFFQKTYYNIFYYSF